VATKRRFHRNREVRWLSSKKCWGVTIGRNLTTKNKLADRDWYFPGHLPKQDADKLANQKAQQWEVICRDWHRTDEPLLAAFGDPFPAEPRWNAVSSGSSGRVLTPDEVTALRNEDRVSHEEIVEAMQDYTMRGFIDFYERDRADELDDELLRGTSSSKLINQMRRAMDFFPDDVPARQLVAAHFRQAKGAMKKANLAPRSRVNLLSAAVKLLDFIYERYMGGVGLPAGLRAAVEIKKAKAKSVKTYTLTEVKSFLKATKGTLHQLDLMLALNCGMNPQDIGRLLIEEIDLTEQSTFWDREKEPGNDFRLHHMFWPETLRLVKHWLNDGSRPGRPVLDYRYGPKKPVKLDPQVLALLDDDQPRYWIMPGGSEKNRVSDGLRKIVTGVTFVPLRKTANNWLENLIEQHDSTDRALAAKEISDRFLGHGTESLRIVYRQFKKGAYTTMNRYLAKLGDKLRAEGLFESVVI